MADIRHVDLNLLLVLDALLQERSVSRAAQRLALAQPTVSGMLRRLRKLLADPLFVRTQRGIRPTPRAEALAPRVRHLLEEAEQIVAGDRFDARTTSAVFRISTMDYMLKAVVVPLAARLREAAPGIRLAVTPMQIAEIATQLASGAIDLAVTIPQFAAAALPSRRLYRETYVGVVSSDHPMRARTPSLAQFCHYAHVLVSPTGGSFEGPVDSALTALGRTRHVALSVPSFLVLPEILIATDLIAVVPRRLFAARSERLRTFELPVKLPSFDVIATWHRRMHHDPTHRWLRSNLQAVAARGVESESLPASS
jgi:DNA-binding transcriptional LysR family regulator